MQKIFLAFSELIFFSQELWVTHELWSTHGNSLWVEHISGANWKNCMLDIH